MRAFWVCLLFWIIALVGENAVFASLGWLQPNLLFLFSMLFCLHWRGSETYFISLFFGLTADCFSTVPFGVFGSTFLGLSFFFRWYGLKIFQDYLSPLVLIIGLATVIENFFALLLLDLFFNLGRLTIAWLSEMLLIEVIPTAIMAAPGMSLLKRMEYRYRIRLAERKY